MKEDTDTLIKNNPDYFTEKIRSPYAKKLSQAPTSFIFAYGFGRQSN